MSAEAAGTSMGEFEAAAAEATAEAAGAGASSAESTSVDVGGQSAEAGGTGVEAIDPLLKIEQLLNEGRGPQQAQTPEEPVEKLLEGVGQNTPAAQRIQKLANDRREAMEQNALYARQVQEAQGYIGQVQQWAQREVQAAQAQNAQLQAQISALTAQFQAMANMRAKTDIDEINADPAKQVYERWKRGMTEEVQKLVDPIKEENERIKQEFNDYRNGIRRQQLSSQYQDSARQAVANVVLRDIPAQFDERQTTFLAGQILAAQANLGIDVQQAAQLVRETSLRFAQGLLKAYSAPRKAAMGNGQNAPTPPSTKRVNGEGASIPPIEQLNKMGYKDELEYISRNG